MLLSEIIASIKPFINDNDQEIADIAQSSTDASNEYKTGLITLSEYQELISDLKLEQVINIDASRLATRDFFDTIFNEIVSAISIAQSL
jgi:hypothetical protein